MPTIGRSGPTLCARTWRATIILPAMLLAFGCDNEGELTEPQPTPPMVSGRVSFGTDNPVVGAEVSIGAATATTGPNGHFELTDLASGASMLRVGATGFEPFEIPITVPSGGGLIRNVSLTRIELFEFEDFALYVPATVSTPRAILLALGGPDTRAFASNGQFGAPLPELEAALTSLGRDVRELASSNGLAVLGTSVAAMPNTADSDRRLLDVILEAAAMSGRPELASAPILVYGISGGGPQASGFTARNPERVVGLFLKVPIGVASLTEQEALGVPVYIVLAELDDFVDNAALTAAFETHRGTGALWALAPEPGVPHLSLTAKHHALTINWMRTILDVRLGATVSDPLRSIPESSGWLGNPAVGVAPWNSYKGARQTASWFPSSATADEWANFVGAERSVSRLAERIAFVKMRDDNWEIYVMNADGSDEMRLTNHPAYDAEPQWSPDGTRIAFTSDRDGQHHIYVMNSDGSSLVNLTRAHGTQSGSPTWSPDGKRIAFFGRGGDPLVDPDSYMDIHVVNADGSDLVRLVNKPGFSSIWPAWSPDGTRIAFIGGPSPNLETLDIYVMDADGSNVVRLTDHPDWDTRPAWSPDGTRIAFYRTSGMAPGNIYVMNADGSNTVRLKPFGGSDPAWSPDGTQIVFSCESQICVMNADGSDRKRVTNGEGSNFAPAWWSPS